jgi:hypothetical protein
MRVAIEAVSEDFEGRCSADEGDRFKVFWTEATQFDSALLTGDLEETLDRRRLGFIGEIFLQPEAEDEEFDEDLDLGEESPLPSPTAGATPTGTPGLATSEGEQRCVLLASQIGTSQGAIPTTPPRTTARPTALPSPTPIATATPTRSPSPQPTEEPTEKPTATPP